MPEIGKSKITPEKLFRFIPVAVFFVALAVRLVGIGWGLKNSLHNQSYHPDEEDIFHYSQGIDPAHGKFTPGFYNYGTFYLTTLRIASDMTAAYTGAADPKNSDSVWSFIARCNLAGRIISALCGAGTAVVVFLIALRLSGMLGGLASAAVLAFAPAHVVHSRFQTVDVMAVFLLALSAMFALRLIPKDGEDFAPKTALRLIALSGVFAGLSAGTKYTGILGVLTLFAVLVACRRTSLLKDGSVGLGAALAAFIISCPGVLLDNEAFMRDFKYEMLHTSTGHGLVFEGTANGFVYHLFNLFQGLGTISTLMGAGALMFAAYRKKTWAVALLAFMIPYYLLIGRAEVKFIRYTFPLYIGLAVGFGWAVAKGQEHKKWGRLAVGAGILAIGGLDQGGLIGTVQFTADMMRRDPRDAAAEYLKTAAKSQSDLVVGLPEDPWFWSPPLFPDSTISRGFMRPSKRLEEMQQATNPRETYVMTPEGNPTQFDKRLVTDVRPGYITYSSFEYADPERFQGRTDISDEAKALARQYKEFIDALKSDYTLEKGFGWDVPMVQDLEYVQPQVVVWKRKSTR